jgi:hypothetical protein
VKLNLEDNLGDQSNLKMHHMVGETKLKIGGRASLIWDNDKKQTKQQSC